MPQTITHNAERVRARQELRRSNVAARHTHRYREARKGSGKGGRGAAKRRACADR